MPRSTRRKVAISTLSGSILLVVLGVMLDAWNVCSTLPALPVVPRPVISPPLALA
jgi:hypothetical protein